MGRIELDLGITGAKRQSYSAANPREMLERIMQRDPDATLVELQNEFWVEIRKHAAQLREISDYWVTNTFRSLRPKLTRPRETVTAERAKRQQAIEAETQQVMARIEEIATEKAKIMLLDMVQPNGKKLRDCTGSYCLQAGGWLIEVGRIVGPDKLVGNVLSEARLKQLHDVRLGEVGPLRP